MINLWCRVLLDHSLDSSFVLNSVLFEEIVCIGLSGRLGVGVVQEVLNTKQDLLYRDRRLPSLLFV